MSDFDRIVAIRAQLVSIASELRGLKCALETNEDASLSVENAEDSVDEAVQHLHTAMNDITYA